MALTDKLTAIGNAIRAKTGGSSLIPLADMPSAIAGIQTGITPESLTYDQQNASVIDYLANTSYDPTDYTTSNIDQYASASTSYNKSLPAGVTITIPESGTLILIDGSGSLSYSVSAGEHTVFNITPGVTGSYLVKNNSDKIVAAGLLKPTGSLRMIHASATANVRDLGGWACDGGTVKYGILYRGGEIAAADADLFHDLLGIRAELNLRWDDEIERNYSLIGSDVEFKHISGPWYSVGNSTNWSEDAHKQILNYVMDHVIAGKPVYFHCAAGADRTGTIAFILEAILGMSQSDMDKEYELTCFYSGVATDAAARRRNEDEWKNFMAQFAAYSGNTMRDRVVNWAQTIGITIEKINAFRAALIDGDPAALSSTIGNVSVTKSLTGVSGNNNAATNAAYQPYEISLVPDFGNIINSVQVTMGGLDITDQVFTGTKSILRHAVSYALTDCAVTDSPVRRSVVSGECFCCVFETDSGYTLDGATVSITMGGINVSNYYQDGKITIPRVTGDLVIRATAVSSAPAYTNQITESKEAIGGSSIYNSVGYKNGYRYNSSKTEAAQNGMFTTGLIYVPAGATVRFYGDIISGSNGGANSGIYKTDGSLDYDFTPLVFYNHSTTEPNSRFGSYVYDDDAHSLRSFVWNRDYDVWMKFTCVGTFADGTTVITVNEEM